MKEFKNILIGILLAVGIFVAGAIVGSRHGNGKLEEVRDTIIYVDTIKYLQPVAKDSTVVKYVKVKVPVSDKDTIYTPLQSFVEGDSDSAEVVLPITQKVYEDSTYKAWVSGYLPNLDSINVYQKQEIVTITKFQKPKKWGIGAGVGATFGTDGKIKPGIYVGIHRSLIEF